MARERFHNDLKPYAILMAGVFGDLENMTEDELVELAEACDKPNQTNCWCYTYKAAHFIGPLVTAELSRRGVPPNVLGEGPPKRRSRVGNLPAQLAGGPSRPAG